MNYSLGARNAKAAHGAQFHRTMPIGILESSIARTWTSPGYSDSSRWNLDGDCAISGDDLARINAFEPADPNLKPIGEQRGIWSDVRLGIEARRRARATRKAAA